MNNKQLGTAFEREVCELLKQHGYWVHFMSPDARGAQPFDIIAVKNGKALAMDCKTSVSKYFPLSRLEDNQVYAFEKWIACGNVKPLVVIKYQNEILTVSYPYLRDKGRVNLEEDLLCIEDLLKLL